MKNRLKIAYWLIVCFIVFITNSCKKAESEEPKKETGSLTDIDGNVYKTVKIGDQWWMVENLRVKKYSDGSSIVEVLPVESDSVWANQTVGAACCTDTNYGMLYNWHAVSSVRKLAPIGWHIPSDAEWKTLEKYLGMSEKEVNNTAWRGTDEAEKLIIKSSIGWPSATVPFGSNESGFTALPGGCRLFNGTSNASSSTAFWWTSTASNNEGWYRYLDYQKKNIFRQHTYKQYGLSVRCVKD